MKIPNLFFFIFSGITVCTGFSEIFIRDGDADKLAVLDERQLKALDIADVCYDTCRKKHKMKRLEEEKESVKTLLEVNDKHENDEKQLKKLTKLLKKANPEDVTPDNYAYITIDRDGEGEPKIIETLEKNLYAHRNFFDTVFTEIEIEEEWNYILFLKYTAITHALGFMNCYYKLNLITENTSSVSEDASSEKPLTNAQPVGKTCFDLAQYLVWIAKEENEFNFETVENTDIEEKKIAVKTKTVKEIDSRSEPAKIINTEPIKNSILFKDLKKFINSTSQAFFVKYEEKLDNLRTKFPSLTKDDVAEFDEHFWTEIYNTGENKELINKINNEFSKVFQLEKDVAYVTLESYIKKFAAEPYTKIPELATSVVLHMNRDADAFFPTKFLSDEEKKKGGKRPGTVYSSNAVQVLKYVKERIEKIVD